MNKNKATPINFFVMKLFFLITILLVSLTPVNAQDGLYERGKNLVKQEDFEKALKAFELAANIGDLDAMTAVGIMYIGGIGIQQNDEKGLKYIKNAAKQSHPKAQYTLGAIYYLGVGVPSDFK